LLAPNPGKSDWRGSAVEVVTGDGTRLADSPVQSLWRRPRRRGYPSLGRWTTRPSWRQAKTSAGGEGCCSVLRKASGIGASTHGAGSSQHRTPLAHTGASAAIAQRQDTTSGDDRPRL